MILKCQINMIEFSEGCLYFMNQARYYQNILEAQM